MLSARPPRAFTLLELIVTIVVLAVLAAVAVPTFQAVIVRSQDASAEQTLRAVDREARALAAFDSRPAAAGDYRDAAGDTAGAAPGLYAAGYTTSTYARPGVIGVRVSGTSAGLALVSGSGNCVLLRSDAGSVSVFKRGPLGVNCSGSTALAGSGAASPSNVLDCEDGRYSAEYFTNTSLSGPAAVTRCESALDYDWGGGGPAGLGRTEHFSARWTSTTPSLEAGRYRFAAVADDGVRVWVDGVLVIDQWRITPPAYYEATLDLAAGRHTVQVEYFEYDGGAVARSWYDRVG